MARTKSKRYQSLLTAFESRYGSNDSRLDRWVLLCKDCNVTPGSSITQCRQILKRINVNIVELLEAYQDNAYPTLFPSRRALRDWTFDNEMWFPKRLAKENRFLAGLLITMGE